MTLLILIYFVLYTIAFGYIIAIGFFMQREKEQEYLNEESGIDTDQLTVLIPFRNEAHRIGPLLESISNAMTLPKELVFIDDHSTDETIRLIKEQLPEYEYRLIQLPEGVTGKKKALRYAISEIDSTYILTMDADVVFQPDYFDALSKYGDADMYILPAIMMPENWFERLYELDLVLVNAANAGLSGIKRPIIASGANLFYKKDTFDRVDDLDSHIHAASGDDTYLLRDFRENKTIVRLVTDPRVAITTETPRSFREFIDQRLRWIGKTGDLRDHLSTFLAIVQAAFTLGFFVLLFYTLFQGDIRMAGILFGLKTLIDLFLFYPFFTRIGRLCTWCWIPLYELLFPFYTMILLTLLPFYKPKWKGRSIYSDSKIK